MFPKVAEWAEMVRPSLARHLPRMARQEEWDRLEQAAMEISKLDTHRSIFVNIFYIIGI